MSYNSDIPAKQLMDSLIQGEDIIIPQVDFDDSKFNVPGDAYSDLYNVVSKLTNEDLTTRVINGDGVFDSLMASIKSHLQGEYDRNRITGAEYTKAYIALTESALANSVQYLLGRDAAFWQAANAQTQAITARIQLETAKAQYASIYLEALTVKANYALTKLKLATEDANYAQIQYQVENMLPVQRIQITKQNDLLDQQIAGQTVQNSQLEYNLDELSPAQKDLLMAQVVGQDRSNTIASYNITTMLPTQKALLDSQKEGQDLQNDQLSYNLTNMLPEQVKLIKEQMETQRAQTSNTRSDGFTTISGVLGKQKDLYTQQITTYQRDAEVKAAKIFTDAWITQKTIDEGADIPPLFDPTSGVNPILATIKANNNL